MTRFTSHPFAAIIILALAVNGCGKRQEDGGSAGDALAIETAVVSDPRESPAVAPRLFKIYRTSRTNHGLNETYVRKYIPDNPPGTIPVTLCLSGPSGDRRENLESLRDALRRAVASDLLTDPFHRMPLDLIFSFEGRYYRVCHENERDPADATKAAQWSIRPLVLLDCGDRILTYPREEGDTSRKEEVQEILDRLNQSVRDSAE
ncbi:MAG: hypothetical protein EOP88_07735 [Verrucomicrobiaceae bacterium]|nr:MAG: hypothetical protein EOP88_07735 [Verrucomicrobiaceae bacterium]